MVRRIINIDRDKCTGCGLCAGACHEGAISMVDGKAVLTREDFCDGLGDCLPACPAGAITFVERETAAYDREAVMKAKASPAGGCPGSAAREIKAPGEPGRASCLSQWPVQIKLAPPSAPYYGGCRLLIAADCTAYAYAAFHRDYMDGRVTLVGCPKLDGVDYSIKLTRILAENDVRDVTLARMEVPCCGGLEYALKKAVSESGKAVPVTVDVISIRGELLSSAPLG